MHHQGLKPQVLWMTGLSGAGKTTLALAIADKLKNLGHKVEVLDGDVIRQVFPQTGFSRLEREQHVKRVGFIASLLEKHGVIVIGSLISPYRESRDFVRGLCQNFLEVHVSTPLETCEARDPKGLYKKVRRGEISGFTGIDDPYEEPLNPEVVLDTAHYSLDEGVELLMRKMK